MDTPRALPHFVRAQPPGRALARDGLSCVPSRSGQSKVRRYPLRLNSCTIVSGYLWIVEKLFQVKKDGVQKHGIEIRQQLFFGRFFKKIGRIYESGGAAGEIGLC